MTANPYTGFPNSLAERLFPDLRHWRTPHRGGHFMAHEEPEQIADDLRAFFRPLRSDVDTKSIL